jgi:hypothetical protein
MINRELVKKAQKLWSVDYIPKEVNRHNRRAWIRAVQMVGDRWLLLRKVERLAEPRL